MFESASSVSSSPYGTLKLVICASAACGSRCNLISAPHGVCSILCRTICSLLHRDSPAAVLAHTNKSCVDMAMRHTVPPLDITHLPSLEQNGMAGTQTRRVGSTLDTQDVRMTCIWNPNSHLCHLCDVSHSHVCFSQVSSHVTKPVHTFTHASPACSLCLIRLVQIAICCVSHCMCLVCRGL